VTDEQRLGLAVIECDGGGGACPGLVGRLVVNDPKDGRPPRAFFVRPRGRRLDEVEVVVIGQNPAGAGGFERHLNRLLLGHADRFNLMAEAAVSTTSEERYYQAIDLLVRNLSPDGRERVVLWAEVVYCESRKIPHPKNPSKQIAVSFQEAVPFCTDRHLERQLAAVPKGVTVICNGKIAADWFGKWAGRMKFDGLWMRVDHSSGTFTFKNLFEGGKLRPRVQENWERLKRERRPIHLMTGADLTQPKIRNPKRP
jgi:hypothetical protein